MDVTLIGLIGLGLAYAAAKLEGPLGLFEALRALVQQAAIAPDWVKRGAGCPFCWAFYTTLVAAALVLPAVDWASFVAGWLAGFGLSVLALLWVGL